VSESASIGGFNAASSLAGNGSAMASAGGSGLSASGPGGTVAEAGFCNVSKLASNEMLLKPAIVVHYLFDKIFNVSLPIHCTRSGGRRIFFKIVI